MEKLKTVLLETTVAWAGHDFSLMPGDTRFVDEETARARIAAGLAKQPTYDLREKPTDARIPSLAERSAEYARLLDQYEALRAEETRLVGEIETAERLSDEASAEFESRKREQQQGRIARILGKVQVVADAPVEFDVDALRSRLGDVRGALKDLSPDLQRAKQEASRMICDEIEPEHTRLVVGICEALIAAHASWSEYVRFTSRLSGRDIEWSRLRAMHPRFLNGSPFDSQGGLAGYLRDAVEHGFIPAGVVPESMRSGAIGVRPPRRPDEPKSLPKTAGKAQ